MPNSSNFYQPFIPRRQIVFYGDQAMAPPAFVQPMAPQQFEPFNLEPPIHFDGRNQPVELPNTAQEINTSIDDLNEVPSKRSAGLFFKVLVGMGIATIILAAALIPALVVNLVDKKTTTSTSTTSSTTTTTTTTTTFICNPSCVNGNCIAQSTCSCNTGWYGSICASPNCTSPCLNGGNCTAPNTCVCNTAMWSGSTCQTPVRVFWGFDSTLQDLYSNFNGVGSNSPTYSTPGYNGVGSCLWLTRSSSQSVTVNNPPLLNMANISFTFEAWIYAQTLCTNSTCLDNAIFGQFHQNTQDRSFYTMVRNQRLYMGFLNDDISGTQILSTGQWYHIAFIYDYSTSRQYLYLNGYLDVSRNSAGPYQGSSGALTIGTNVVNSPNNYFDGCLDSILYVSRAKNATEVLFDATLVAYLPFDGNTLLDSGPLSINGTGLSYSYTSSGRVNVGVSLQNSSSYVQITGLRRIGTNSWPYSVAIWIKPTSLAGGTIMHLSSRTDGAQTSAWCLPIMGLTSSGQIAINSWNNTNVPLTGPLMVLNTWTHIVGTYSPSNGERLYVNGTLVASTGPYSFMAGSVPMTITVGSSLLGVGACNTGTIQMGRFYGSLDEFYVYARELTVSEIVALVNV